jgi:hypothetical protein
MTALYGVADVDRLFSVRRLLKIDFNGQTEWPRMTTPLI